MRQHLVAARVECVHVFDVAELVRHGLRHGAVRAGDTGFECGHHERGRPVLVEPRVLLRVPADLLRQVVARRVDLERFPFRNVARAVADDPEVRPEGLAVPVREEDDAALGAAAVCGRQIAVRIDVGENRVERGGEECGEERGTAFGRVDHGNVRVSGFLAACAVAPVQENSPISGLTSIGYLATLCAFTDSFIWPTLALRHRKLSQRTNTYVSKAFLVAHPNLSQIKKSYKYRLCHCRHSEAHVPRFADAAPTTLSNHSRLQYVQSVRRFSCHTAHVRTAERTAIATSQSRALQR